MNYVGGAEIDGSVPVSSWVSRYSERAILADRFCVAGQFHSGRQTRPYLPSDSRATPLIGERELLRSVPGEFFDALLQLK